MKKKCYVFLTSSLPTDQYLRDTSEMFHPSNHSNCLTLEIILAKQWKCGSSHCSGVRKIREISILQKEYITPLPKY